MKQNHLDRSFSETFPLAWTERYAQAHAEFSQAAKPAPKGHSKVSYDDRPDYIIPQVWLSQPCAMILLVMRSDPFQNH